MPSERNLRILRFQLGVLKVLLLLIIYLKRKSVTRPRRWWIRPINLNRNEAGYFTKTFLPMKENDPEEFYVFTRMKINVYNILLTLVQDDLAKKSIREPINPECRLAVTLIYLSQGVSIKYLASSFKLGRSTVREIILETCDIIWKLLSPTYVARPTEVDYNLISHDFNTRWNMPNCVGAIDGKHIQIQAPPRSGSQFFNYKKTYSIVLLGVCDPNYTFTDINVGAFGSQSDGRVFRNSTFGRELINGQLNLPDDKQLPNSERIFPHYFVADAAFPLQTNLMRPYPGKHLSEEKDIFNYRLSRARRLIENAFGILVNRWRILRNSLNLLPENVEKVVLATVALHNFIKLNDTSNEYIYGPDGRYVDWEDSEHRVHDGEWRREGRLPSARVGANNSSRLAFHLRDQLCDYFMNEGAVPFQYNRH